MTSVPWLGTLRAGEFCTRHRPAKGKPKTTVPLTRLRYRRTGVGSPYGDGVAVSTDRRPTPELAPRAVSPTVRLRRPSAPLFMSSLRQPLTGERGGWPAREGPGSGGVIASVRSGTPVGS